jgi:hypothetical protein
MRRADSVRLDLNEVVDPRLAPVLGDIVGPSEQGATGQCRLTVVRLGDVVNAGGISGSKRAAGGGGPAANGEWGERRLGVRCSALTWARRM